MKKLILIALAGSCAMTSFANSFTKQRVISKDEKDNIVQILYMAGAIGGGLATVTRKANDLPKLIAVLVAAGCGSQWIRKIQERAKSHGYESSLEFFEDDTVSKIKQLWNKINIMWLIH